MTIYTLFSFSVKKSENYTLIRKIDSVEIRQYPALIYASYFSQSGSNSQFRVLANYIFGGNNKNEKIGMTSPVNMRLSSKKQRNDVSYAKALQNRKLTLNPIRMK